MRGKDVLVVISLLSGSLVLLMVMKWDWDEYGFGICLLLEFFLYNCMVFFFDVSSFSNSICLFVYNVVVAMYGDIVFSTFGLVSITLLFRVPSLLIFHEVFGLTSIKLCSLCLDCTLSLIVANLLI